MEISNEWYLETADYIKARINDIPETAIILGSGLGKLAEELENKIVMDYKDIPHFPVSTVVGHAGQLIYGKLNYTPVLVMSGRFHYYEGYDINQVTYPIRSFAKLGIKNLILTNAAGGVNLNYVPGDLMLIKDHINFSGVSPLRGKNLDEFGPRFPDMTNAYDNDIIMIVEEACAELGITINEGVYAYLQGPNYETPAEIKALRALGADAVGMSTVPEVIVANHCGINVFGMSVITDLGVEGKIVEVSHEEVQKAADEAQPRMTTIMRELINRI